MPGPVKGSQSGLRTVQRDWKEAPKSSQEIPWSPSPPMSRPLTGAEQRMRAIEAAMAESTSGYNSRQQQNQQQPLKDTTVINKRPSPTSGDGPAKKKARQLPTSWEKEDSLSAPSFNRPSNSSVAQPYPSPVSSLPSSSTAVAGVVPARPVASSSSSKVASVFLSLEQTQILKLVQDGESIFYTGSAGTGKSVLLREIIKTLRKQYSKVSDAVAITASTGIAACNIGGVTIHSFAGFGLGIEPAPELVKKVRKNKKALGRWLRTKVLIIDEVSMVDAELFDKLATVGSTLRKHKDPFGGIQVIVTGDFFQLPPVTKGSAQVKFAFEAEAWKTTIKRTFNLTRVFRQSDQEFVNMLNEMRFGKLTATSIARFRALRREITYEDGINATELFPRREDVDRSNSSRMSLLQTEQRVYRSIDGGTIQDPMQRQKMLANFMATETLTLRQDAQVMLIKNIDEQLVNGSVGKIVAFGDPADPNLADLLITGSAPQKKNSAVVGHGAGLYPIVEWSHLGGKRNIVTPEVWKVELPDGEIQASRSQLPLILSWAMSIHKSQGQTLNRVRVDLGKVFEKGQAYVALSRATSLEGLQVLNFDPNKVKAHPKVTEWSKSLETVQDMTEAS